MAPTSFLDPVKKAGAFIPLIAWWAYCVIRMIADARRDRGPTGLPNDLPNWHNQSGDLTWYGALVLLELIGVVAVLRPWSYHRSWRRAVAALGLFAPWTFIFLALLIHSGGIMLLHFFWIAGMCAWLVGLAFVSAIAALAARNGGVTEQAV